MCPTRLSSFNTLIPSPPNQSRTILILQYRETLFLLNHALGKGFRQYLFPQGQVPEQSPIPACPLAHAIDNFLSRGPRLRQLNGAVCATKDSLRYISDWAETATLGMHHQPPPYLSQVVQTM